MLFHYFTEYKRVLETEMTKLFIKLIANKIRFHEDIIVG